MDPDELRLLSEISHKLDYAIRNVGVPPGGSGGGNGSGPSVATLQSMHELIQPDQDNALLHERILRLAADVTKADRGFLMLIEEGRKLRFKAGHSMDQKTLAQEGVYSRSIIKQVVQTGEAVLVADSSDPDADTASSVRGLQMRSIVCAPMLFGGSVGGVIYLDARAIQHQFTPKSLELLQAICRLGTTSIENAAKMGKASRVNPDASKVQENFERLLDVGRTISSTLVLDELLELVIEKVLEVTRADRGFLMLIEEGNSEPVFKIGLNWNKKDGPARRKRKLEKHQFGFSRTVTNRTLEGRKSVVLTDVNAGGGDEDPSVSMMQMELSSVMCTPLIEKGEVLGLIYVDSKMSAQEFGDSDLELFEALAGQAAIGLKNAILYTQVAEQQRMESELSIAADMQSDLCPDAVPQIQGIELTGMMEPAREVGGDYYDYVEDTEAPGQVLGIVVGDVSGKGLGAGIVAVMARCFLRSMMGAYGMEDPSQLLGYLNHTLCGELKPGKFMTMLIMVWDARTGKVRYASAGHENIIVWRAASRKAQAITSGGSPLGISRTTGGPTPSAELKLDRGDLLVTYTDGVTEAMDMKDNEYTLERLLALVDHLGGQAPKAVEDAILKDVAKHRGEREQTDDITMVILRRT